MRLKDKIHLEIILIDHPILNPIPITFTTQKRDLKIKSDLSPQTEVLLIDHPILNPILNPIPITFTTQKRDLKIKSDLKSS